MVNSIRPSQHLNEYQLYNEVRPNPAAAPTGMTAQTPTTKESKTDFGEKITPAASWNYLTPTSGNNRGETQFVLSSTVGACINTVKVSDRTAGAFEWQTQLTDGTPKTVSWLVNGRSLDSGTGQGLQPVEFQFERHGTSEQAFHNPTRDGNTAVAQTPYAPNQQFRVHSGKPVYFNAGATSFESCVNPLDFSFPGNGFGFEHGEDQLTKSALWFNHRHYQKIELNFGGSANVHRNTVWTYQPTAFNGAGGTKDPISVGRACSHYCKVNYFNDARVYDLNNMSFVTVPAFTPTPGVNKFRTWRFNQQSWSDDNGVQDGSIPPTITPRACSPYMGVILRNTTDDFCVGVAWKMTTDLQASDPALSQHLEKPTLLTLFSFAGAAATGAIDEPWAVLMDPNSASTRRRAGWIGTVEYIVIGRLAAVTAAMSSLKTGGSLDADPITTLPAAVTAGTVWPPPKRASAHAHEWALYDAVGMGVGVVATKLTRRAGEDLKHFINDFGQPVFPPAEINYLPVPNGQQDVLTDAIGSAGGYINKVRISNRLLGIRYWETECPNGFRVSWCMPGIFPTGSAIQTAEAYLERIDDTDQFFTNPTQMGAGLMNPPTFADPYYTGDHPPVEVPNVRFRQITSAPLFHRVQGNEWDTACYPVEFQGFGAGPNFSQAGYESQNRGNDDDSPALLYGHRFNNHGSLHWRGMKTVHLLDWHRYVPSAWGNLDGEDHNTLSFNGVLLAVKGRFFDKAYCIDLAKGAVAGQFELVGFVAPPATSWFPSWNFTRRFQQLQSEVPAFPTVKQEFARSPYMATMLVNTANNFAIAVAAKLQDADDFFTADETGLATILGVGQFEDDDSTGDIEQAWGAFLFTQTKARFRKQGWQFERFFMLAGLKEDVLADLDTLMRLGDLDTKMERQLPAPITEGTMFSVEESTVTQICNLALAHLGDHGSITSIAPPDGSAQSILCDRYYPLARDALLELRPWSFAEKSVAPEAVTSARSEWQYAYLPPADRLKTFAVGPPGFSAEYLMSRTNPASVGVPFKEALDATDRLLIYTNQQDAVIRYNKRVTDADLFTSQFKVALTYKLAAMLAGPLVKGIEGAKLAEMLENKALAEMGMAAASDGDQEQIDPRATYKPNWIARRTT